MNELEKLWLDYIQRDEYTSAPEIDEVQSTYKELADSILSMVGGNRNRYLPFDSTIHEYGAESEKQGFLNGFRLAMRIAFETLTEEV